MRKDDVLWNYLPVKKLLLNRFIYSFFIVWLAFFPFLITTCTAITKKRCQFDTKTKAKLNKLLPMLLELSVDVLKTKETIVSIFT